MKRVDLLSIVELWDVIYVSDDLGWEKSCVTRSLFEDGLLCGVSNLDVPFELRWCVMSGYLV